MNKNDKTVFAPQLYIPKGITDLSFYEKAFGAIELRRFSNDDGSIHVSEMSIDGALFHFHEESAKRGFLSPVNCNSASVLLGLFVKDVDIVMSAALASGATITSPATSYDYGYRQGELLDPFGHHWMIEMHI